MAKSPGNTPVQKNEQLTITIEDMTHEGSGVGKVDGYPLFIPKTAGRRSSDQSSQSK